MTAQRSAPLDGIRGVALACPIVVHLGLVGSDRGLWLAIGMFFTLSAFLVTSLALKEFETTGNFGLKKFWIRRLRRLMPASLLVLAATVVVAVAIEWPGLAALRGDVLSALAWGANWEQLHGGGYWDAFSPSLTHHFWSLSFEEQVYVIFPLLVIVLVLMRRLSILRWPLARMLGVAAVVMIGLSWTFLWTIDDPSTLYLSTWSRLGEIGWGIAAACWSHASTKRRLTSRQATVLLLVAMAMAAPWWIEAAGDTTAGIRWGITWATPPTAVVIAMLWRYPNTWISRGFSLSIPVWLGRRSYGIYLLHLPIIELLAFHLRSERLPVWGMISAVVATVVGAEAMFRFIEEPFRIGRRIPIDRRFAGALVVAVLAIIPSVLVVTRPDSRVMAIEPPAPPPTTAQSVAIDQVGTTPSLPDSADDVVEIVGNRTVLVIGDSTAWVTRGAVDLALKPLGYTTYGVHMVGCPVGGDVRLKTSVMGGAVNVRDKGEEPGCDEWWNVLLPGWLDAIEPEVVVVVGGYALAWEVDPQGDDNWCQLGDGTDRCKEWAAGRLGALDERVRQHSPLSRIVYTTAGHVDPWGPLDIPGESIDVLNALLRQQAMVSNSPIIDLGSWLDDHLDLTVDGTHLGPDGVEALAPWLADGLPAALGN